MVKDEKINDDVINLEAFRNMSWQQKERSLGRPPSNQNKTPKSRTALFALIMSAIVVGGTVTIGYHISSMKTLLQNSKELENDKDAKKEYDQLIEQDLTRIFSIIKLTKNDVSVIYYFCRLSGDLPLSFISDLLNHPDSFSVSELELKSVKFKNPEKYEFLVKFKDLISKIKGLNKTQKQLIDALSPLYPKKENGYKKYFDKLNEIKRKSIDFKSVYFQGPLTREQLREQKQRVAIAEQNKKALNAKARLNTRNQLLRSRLKKPNVRA